MPPKVTEKVEDFKDSSEDLSLMEKNRELSDLLLTNPKVCDKAVLEIDRLEVGFKGWRIIIRV